VALAVRWKSSLIIVLVVTEDFLTCFVLLLAPVMNALGADKDQVHPVLSRVHECDCLKVATFLAVDILAAGQRRVLDTLPVDLEARLDTFARGGTALDSLTRSRLRLAWAIDTVISLIIMLGLLEVTTDPAVINESPNLLVSLASLLFFWLKHVVALFAEAHSSECCHRNSEFTLVMELYNYI